MDQLKLDTMIYDSYDKNRPLSQDLILSKINKITYFDPRTGSKKTKHCEKHGTEVHHIKEHTTKFVTKPKGKKAVTTITHYKGQKGIFTTFNAMVWTTLSITNTICHI